MTLLGKSNKAQNQRKAAFGAAVVLSSVVVLFMLGLYLMFNKMAMRERHSEAVQHVVPPGRVSEKISVPAVGDERNDVLLRRKMSNVVSKNEEQDNGTEQEKEKGKGKAANVQHVASSSGARPRSTSTSFDQPFNVSLWIDNTPGGGGGAGEVIITVRPAWAPIGARRLGELVDTRFFDGCRFFRVLHNFMGQFGINGDPAVQGQWRGKAIKDDPVKGTNKRGTVTFATSGPNR